mmetsp:Transcript_6957/g.11020  ORF Transcript_6957/g.11020 Transcript_6957/m.11020 type:complete len:240 (+) Transcript_6957:699-1418(+)
MVASSHREQAHMSAALEKHGIDLVKRFSVAGYNNIARSVEQLVPLRMSESANEQDDSELFGYIVGHSKAFWTPFVEWFVGYGNKDARHYKENPVDLYAMEVIARVLGQTMDKVRVYSSIQGPLVAMQRICHISGLAQVDDTLHLCLHDKFGPWFAIRAVLISTVPLTDQALETPCYKHLITDEERTNAQTAFENALKQNTWQAWVTLRDTVHIGREFRYCSDQMEYHYTKNRAILEKFT